MNLKMSNFMKKIALIVATGLLFFLPGCNTIDTWGDGLPEMEHVYYIGFKKTNVNSIKHTMCRPRLCSY